MGASPRRFVIARRGAPRRSRPGLPRFARNDEETLVEKSPARNKRWKRYTSQWQAAVSGKPPPRLANAHPNIVPYEAFRAKDDWMILAIGNDVQFKKFCEVAGAPELAQDPRFAANAARVHNRAALTSRVAELIAAQPLDWWLGTLDAAGVPCGPISTLDRAFADAQAVQRGLKVELPHAAGGTAPGAACPIRLSRTPPLLGQSAARTPKLIRGGV
jgi:crotonobetainyl-CoA:carnitine CoA-transferase CaiB-like acyl-CoA transferase